MKSPMRLVYGEKYVSNGHFVYDILKAMQVKCIYPEVNFTYSFKVGTNQVYPQEV
jgi:hypothetical protein